MSTMVGVGSVGLHARGECKRRLRRRRGKGLHGWSVVHSEESKMLACGVCCWRYYVPLDADFRERLKPSIIKTKMFIDLIESKISLTRVISLALFWHYITHLFIKRKKQEIRCNSLYTCHAHHCYNSSLQTVKIKSLRLET